VSLESDNELVIDRLADEAGLVIDDPWDLVNTATDYSWAIPTLVGLLPDVSSRTTKEALIRALTLKEAKGEPVASAIISEFRAMPMSPEWQDTKWAAGSALDVVATDEVFAELADLALDRRHGKSRQMLCGALANMRSKREPAIAVLRELLKDDDLGGLAVAPLRKLHARIPRDEIEPFLDDRRAWVRRDARAFLSSMEQR
jgi:hypothetical protein